MGDHRAGVAERAPSPQQRYRFHAVGHGSKIVGWVEHETLGLKVGKNVKSQMTKLE